MSRALRHALVAAAIATTPGCALALGGLSSRVEVEVKDAPPGTEVRAIGIETGAQQRVEGPSRLIDVSPWGNNAIAVTAPGREPRLVMIRRELSPWFFLDLALIVGGAAGAAYVFPRNATMGGALLGVFGLGAVATYGDVLLGTYMRAPERVTVPL